VLLPNFNFKGLFLNLKIQDMPVNKSVITTLLFVPVFLSSAYSNAQSKNKSRTAAVIPYNHATLVAPPGMVYVPGGSTYIKYDQSSTDSNAKKRVSLTSFFMDKTETTNQEYRRFVDWVIDSIAVVQYLKDDKYFLDDSASSDKATSSSSADQSNPNAMVTPPGDTTKQPTAATTIDTSKLAGKPADTSKPMLHRRINWARVDHDQIFDPSNEETKAKIAPLLDENGNIRKDAYIFSYTYRKTYGTHSKVPTKVEYKTIPVSVYPDEKVWAQDLPNSQTDLYVENYFNASPFDDYPVVGVNWTQANAFAYWRSLTASAYYNMPEYMNYYKLTYTLPSEAQWVYAAQGFYDMIVASDTAINDSSNIPSAKASMPTDTFMSQNGHDTNYVNNYLAQLHDKHVADSTKRALEKESVEDRRQKRKEDKMFNYYLSDYFKFKKYGGKYSANKYGKNMNDTTFTSDVPVIDSSAVHFDRDGMLSNFKQDEGDYWEDGSALATPVMAFAPNEFGLYNMEGNVSEWVMDAYSPSVFSFVSDLNPVLLYDADSSDADAMKRKVVRGGSFMSNAKQLNPYYRDIEMQEVSHCYLGFRCVMQAPEIVRKPIATRNRTMHGKKVKGKLNGVRLPEIH
jgi:formylglycine-generating enzyme required for sulfatase activity